MKSVLICDAMDAAAVEDLKNCGFINVVYKPEVTAEELLTEIKGMHSCVVRSRTTITKEVIDAADVLECIVRGGVGLDNIEVAYAKTKNIKVLNTPSANSYSVTELVYAMMFALARQVVPATVSMKENKWEKKRFKGIELKGKTLGLIGLGRIGSLTADVGKALGMNVIAYEPYPNPEFVKDTKLVDSDTVFATSDFISVHIPKLPDTVNFINADRIGKMKKSAFLIDCARGGVLDEAALYAALREGKIAGAGLDVFSKEPPDDVIFKDLDNVVLTPHIGAQTKEAQERVSGEVADILKKELK